MRLFLATVMALAVLLPPTTMSVSAASGDRTLHLRYTHTGATGSFTFRRGGKYDQNVLKQLNIFLADWRTKEPTNMDPALFDLMWSVYQDVGGRQPINIVSSYRSPKTNAMLRSKSSGVAENSQHVKGKAIDFFIPGVNLTKLREAAMRHQVGGVGYYPTSGSPFVHLDTGSVRAWPRMTRAQLKKVFPDGRTLHLPTDGKPLSNEGRRYAEAQWRKCRAVPCNGREPAPTTMLASVDSAPIPATKPRTLMGMIFGDGEQRPAEIRTAALQEPTQRTVATIDIVAPVPLPRPGTDQELPIAAGEVAANGAPIPAVKSQRLMLATRPALPIDSGETAVLALAALHGPATEQSGAEARADLVTAYAPATLAGGSAQSALRAIIEGQSRTDLPTVQGPPEAELELDIDTVHTASLGGGRATAGLGGMLDGTFRTLTGTAAPAPMRAALADLVASRQPNRSIERREVELVAPEIDHVNETLVHPVLMSSRHFAVLTEAEGYLDKGTELGPLSGRIGFFAGPDLALSPDRFATRAPLLVAAR